MKRFFTFILLLSVAAAAVLSAADPMRGTAMLKQAMPGYESAMKQDLLCLMLAYPENIADVERSGEQVFIVLKSGNKIIYDDKKAKNSDAKIAYPDLQDMMEQPYPDNTITELLEKDKDPGRGRVYSLLNEVYGSSRQQIEKKLVSVRTNYGTFQFNSSNKAAEALENAMKELALLVQKRPDIKKNAFPCSGTYNYRVISGTNRLSPHAYGIAIDLARDKRDYWQWASREEGQKRLSTYPKEIVEIFEKNNFIWGGKWGHFDILHFEYRPEILIKARYFAKSGSPRNLWYVGVPVEDEYVKACIKKIDETIR